jgi:hypothetical protein
MAWEKLLPPRLGTAGLTVSITGKSPRLAIRISRALADEMIFSERADVFIGIGADSGCLKVQPHKDGTYALTTDSKASAFKILLKPPLGAPDHLDATKLDAQMDDGAIVFAMPWHVRAGNRVVEEAEAEAEAPRPAASDMSEYVSTRVFDGTRPLVSTAVARIKARHSPPPTLDSAKALSDIKDALEEIEDRPLNGSVKSHVYADSPEGLKFEFNHNCRSCQLPWKQHAVVTRLHAAMLKEPLGFLDYDILTKLAGTNERAIMQATLSAARKPLKALGLQIVSVPGFGYRMEEVIDG